MRRRDFIILISGAAGALTCADVFAAPKSPMARTGLLVSGLLPPIECCAGADPECKSPPRDIYQIPKCAGGPGALLADLLALGWREGENLQIEQRFDYGD